MQLQNALLLVHAQTNHIAKYFMLNDGMFVYYVIIIKCNQTTLLLQMDLSKKVAVEESIRINGLAVCVDYTCTWLSGHYICSMLTVITSWLKLLYIFRNSSSSAMRWSRRTFSSSVTIRISQQYSIVVQQVTEESAIILNTDKITNEPFLYKIILWAAQILVNLCIYVVRPTRLLSIHHLALL